MKKLKVVFMGTPEFCVPILEYLINNCNVVGVVTKPDSKVGRKHEIVYSPIKKKALENNIKVVQPVKIKEEYQEIIDLKPDIIITCAYGQIIPDKILNFPKYGCINVHASLLPKLRGGAPIHKAIIYGYEKTGITIMYMDSGMDTGDMISKSEVIIDDNDTTEILHNKLSDISVSLLKDTLPKIIDGTNEKIKQDDSLATYAYNIKREEEHVDFNKNTKEIYNQIRGLNSWPGAYSNLNGKQIKIWESKKMNEKYDLLPGTIINIDKEGILVATLDKSILITLIQLPGKKKTYVKDFVNGIKKEDYIGKIFN